MFVTYARDKIIIGDAIKNKLRKIPRIVVSPRPFLKNEQMTHKTKYQEKNVFNPSVFIIPFNLDDSCLLSSFTASLNRFF